MLNASYQRRPASVLSVSFVKSFLGFDVVYLLVVVNVELPMLEQMSGRCLRPMGSNVVGLLLIVVIEGLPTLVHLSWTVMVGFRTLERMSGCCLLAMESNMVQLLGVVIVGLRKLERMFGN